MNNSLYNITTNINISRITLTNISFEQMQQYIIPFGVFVLAIVLYSVFIFHFYKFIARKEIFIADLQRFNRARGKFLARFFFSIIYIFKFFFVFPLIAFFWFVVFSLLLSIISKHDIDKTILISVVLISAIRITSYYSEDLSRDLAKMVPFALLGIFITDMNSVGFSPDSLHIIFQQFNQIVNYLIFFICIEVVMRFMSGIVYLLRLKRLYDKNRGKYTKLYRKHI
ncbi:hypothetical protein KY334_01725 [Candidatus Woesearchaeota archaeon]|nr:hypothetical protein [Candidatus Woesearchaeota archaeon]